MKKRLLSSVRSAIAVLFMVFATNLAPTMAAFAEQPLDVGNPNPVTCPTGTGLSQEGNNCKVTICHATASVQNPYVMPTVDFDAADGNAGNDNGQGDHFLEHTGPVFNSTMQQGDSWGDIIPPIPGIHGGLNWTAEGQAIYNNGCAPVTPPEETEVTPAAVTFNDVCGTANDTYTVPSTTGVTYSVPAGTYPGTGIVNVTAMADQGYTLTGTASWSHLFTDEACPTNDTHVTPAAVTFNDVCGTANDTYTVPTTTGVTYSASAGIHAGSGSVTVTATANQGFVLDGTTSWSHTFTDEACPSTDVCPNIPGDQTLPLPTGIFQQNDNTCKIVICHATSAVNNPYVQIPVAIDAADGNAGNDNGQGDHFLEHTGPVFNSTMQQGDSWGDIIPPIPGIHGGLNWTAEGQAIYNNDCVPTTPPSETDVCPNIPGNQSSLPEGTVLDNQGNCITPGRGGEETPPTTTPPVVQILSASKPLATVPTNVNAEELVNTGTNAMLSIFVGLFILGLTAGLAIATPRRVYE